MIDVALDSCALCRRFGSGVRMQRIEDALMAGHMPVEIVRLLKWKVTKAEVVAHQAHWKRAHPPVAPPEPNGAVHPEETDPVAIFRHVLPEVRRALRLARGNRAVLEQMKSLLEEAWTRGVEGATSQEEGAF